MNQKPIYFDYAATTPTDPRVVEAMLPYLQGEFGNPASRSHAYGWSAESAVDKAREEVAQLVGCEAKDIIWTSGATESINLAIKGAGHFYAEEKGRHIITVATEHKATLDTCREMERLGFMVTIIKPDSEGMVSEEAFRAAIRKDTVLASVMLVNNEIGVVQDVVGLGNICHENGIVFHVDAAQATGKVAINVGQWPVDLMSFSAHKTYGPKGVGALFVRRKPRIRLIPQIHGGGHERGFRSGTLPTHQIVGMGKAFDLARLEMNQELPRIAALKNQLWQGIQDMSEIYLNGHAEKRVPHNLNVSFNFVEGESLMMALKNIAVSSGSACTSASLEPSYVLRAIGRSDELAHSSLRISLGRFTTEDDVKQAIGLIRDKVAKLRELSPLWEMHQEGINVDSFEWKTTH